MAVNLIRKNNQPSVTAYQDTVLFHAIKGVNGVFSDIGDAFSLSYNGATQHLTVHSGIGILYGRQFQIEEGQELTWDLSAISGVKYMAVYVEVDLRDPTDEKAIFKLTTAPIYYPGVNPGDNLLVTPTGLARMLLFYIYRSASGQMTITQKYTAYRYDWIPNADFASNANTAQYAVNANKVGNTTIFTASGVLKATLDGAETTEIIERKRIIYNGSSVLYNTASVGQIINLSENVLAGDILEFQYEPIYVAGGNNMLNIQRVRMGAVAGLSGVTGVNLSALVGAYGKANGFSATSDTFTLTANPSSVLTYRGGYYLLNINGGTLLTNNAIRLQKIYKVIGGTSV